MILCLSCGQPNSTLQEVCCECGHSIYINHAPVDPIPRTLDQNKQLHVLLTQTGMNPFKQSLVETFTGQREISSKNMYFEECKKMIDYLLYLGPIITPKQLSVAKMRRKISAICHDMGWTYKNGKRTDRVDRERVNRFLRKYGIVKKPFYDLDFKELQVTIHQFEKLREYQFKTV